MSRNGQTPSRRDPDRATAPLVGIAEDYAALDGRVHAHARAQIVYAVEGVITVEVGPSLWVVPPQRAVWIPGRTAHRVASPRPFRLRTLYLDPRRARGLPRAVQVVGVPALLRELVLELTRAPWDWRAPGPEARMVAVLLDQLRARPSLALSLPSPRDPRVGRVCAALRADPTDARELSAWARVAGASARNLARLFLRETGMSFGAWRQQLRLLRAVEALGRGASVLEVALEQGYRSPSAFGAMFKRALGTTPGAFFA